MKLEIKKDCDKYHEALNIPVDDWVALRSLIDDEIAEHIKEHEGMNSMDLVKDLCEKYAETITEVAVISLIVGESYAMNRDIVQLIMAKSMHDKEMKKRGLSRSNNGLDDILDKLF